MLRMVPLPRCAEEEPLLGLVFLALDARARQLAVADNLEITEGRFLPRPAGEVVSEASRRGAGRRYCDPH
jgi:hypothetical protein